MYNKRHFVKGYAATVLLLVAVRWAFGIEVKNVPSPARATAETGTQAYSPKGQAEATADKADLSAAPEASEKPLRPHPICGVHDYYESFPDSQEVQLRSAMRWGVKRVRDRNDAEQRKKDLVYVDASPYYQVDRLWYSIPYLVPRAAALLHDIGRCYFDSLQAKGLPLHRMLVTSVLRSESDVERLRRRNGNATENSCHLYGTTFDISYNRYITVKDPEGPERRQVRNDSLKYILCEVLRDKRDEGRCHIKYERKQGCFHITVR